MNTCWFLASMTEQRCLSHVLLAESSPPPIMPLDRLLQRCDANNRQSPAAQVVCPWVGARAVHIHHEAVAADGHAGANRDKGECA